MPSAITSESEKGRAKRLAEGFFDKYLSGSAILDIGYRGRHAGSKPVVDAAIGVDLDYPGYDGKHLPFADLSQHAVHASHCLEHIKDYEAALSDWFRVLRMGGYLIVIVPHQHLYERKARLPSILNPDHKRFYTPSSLLNEINESLPVGGFRIRSLRELDDNFDYSVPLHRHPRGSYEIEVVVEKIVVPEYMKSLRVSDATKATVDFYVKMLAAAVTARRVGDSEALAEYQEILGRLPLPPFVEIEPMLHARLGKDVSAGEIRDALLPILRNCPLDADWYREAYRVTGTDQEIRGLFVGTGYVGGKAPESPFRTPLATATAVKL